MKNVVVGLAATLVSLIAAPAYASPFSVELGNYVVDNVYALPSLAGVVSGLEASAVTYAPDRGTLFFIGDEATGIIEVSLTGQLIGSMAFNWAGILLPPSPPNSTDTEGLAYLGDGRFVVAQERLQNLYQFDYVSGGTANLGTSPMASIGPATGNVGIEGVAYDSRNGAYVTVKQDTPAELRIFSSLSFPNNDVDATPSFPPLSGATSLFGLNSLSDVATLGIVNSLTGPNAGDNLLVLSLDSRRLIEMTRSGSILSSFNLANVLPNNGVEGVTVDANGWIYLVAEQDQTVPQTGQQSQLIVLKPVPEPGTYALMLGGLALLSARTFRRRRTTQA